MKKCMGCMRDYAENYERCPVCGYSEEQIKIEQGEKPEILSPETILGGRYIIGRVLSYTEYAITYIAWDALLQKRVVIKEYFPIGMGTRTSGQNELQIDAQQRETFEIGRTAFEKEIGMLNRNQDIPSLVNIYRCVRENGTSYMVMEYISGCTLQDYIEDHGQMAEQMAADVFSKLALAIEKLHERGIAHWNLSPDNIYLDDDNEIRLIDPGMAKKDLFYALRGGLDIYRRGFIAPELLLGGTVHRNEDLYSLGAVYYFLLTGREPKDSTVRRRKNDLRTGSPAQEKILSLLMEKKPEKRVQNIQMFWEIYEGK